MESARRAAKDKPSRSLLVGFDGAGLFRTPTGGDGGAQRGALSREVTGAAEYQRSLTKGPVPEDEEMIVGGGFGSVDRVTVDDEVEVLAYTTEREHPLTVGLNANSGDVSCRSRIAHRSGVDVNLEGPPDRQRKLPH